MTDLAAINCDDCQTRLIEFALETVEEPTSGQIAAHLSHGCPVCNRQLQEIVADLAAVPQSLPAHQPPLRIERELMQRVANSAAPRPAAVGAQSVAARGGLRSTLLMGGALAVAASLAAVAVFTTLRTGGNRFDQAVNTYLNGWDELQRRVTQAENDEHLTTTPRLEFANVTRPRSDVSVNGYLVTDFAAGQCHVYMFNLPPLAAERAYQLWLIPVEGQPVSAGLCDVGADGTLEKIADVPSSLKLRGIAVSDEPASGSPQPSGGDLYQAVLP